MTGQHNSLEPRNSGKVVLLAGAGASCYLGLPTLDQLLDQAVFGFDEVALRIHRTSDAVLAAPQRFRMRAIFEELIVRLKEYLAISETLRTDYVFRGEFGAMPWTVDNGLLARKWKEALTKCYRVLLDYYGPRRISQRKGSAEFETILRLLEELARLNESPLHVYTTNYDCSYQVLASNCQNISFLSHINNADGRFSDDWFSSRPDLDDSNLPKVYIHRLHGCVGWFTSDGGRTEEIYGSGSDLTILDDDKLPTMCLKLVTSQLVGTNPVFASAFEEFGRHLKDVRVLLVWGYSFRDLEALRVINQAFSQRPAFPVLYVDPFMDEAVAMQRIRDTLHSAPVPLDPNFIPRRIAWTLNDGYDNLINAVINALKREGV